MKQFESDMKARAHLRKIKNAKATVALKGGKITQQRSTDQQDLMVLKLYEANELNSIPIYKLLKPMGLQQYTRELIIRGYGVNISKLAMLRDADRQKLYEDMKVLPGHTTKLNKIIEYITNQAQEMTESGYSEAPSNLSKNIFVDKNEFMQELDEADDYERQLERVLNQYTPKDSTKGQVKRDSKYVFRKDNTSKQGAIFESGVKETAYDMKLPKASNAKYPTSSRVEAAKKGTDSIKKVSMMNERAAEKKSTISRSSGKEVSTKPTVKKQTKATSITSSGKGLPTSLRNLSVERRKKDLTQLEVDLKIDQVKTMYMSVEGAVMTSTIVNLDLEQQCYCIAAYLQSKIRPAEKKKLERYIQQQGVQESQSEKGDIDELEVGNILRESYLHPLYRNTEVEERIDSGEDCNEVEEEIERGEEYQQQQLESSNKLEESSFLGGNDSVSFGLANSLDIFEQPAPTEVDYYVPTTDSISNFVKNIVVSAKMEREVPILAVLYVEKFVNITKMVLTSLNYKRLIVSCLLLASKVWDDESFETPSFSHTFPDYTTVLLNELEKQVLVAIDYQLKLNKKEYAVLYYRLRQYRQPAGRSYQNRALNITRVLELQRGVKKLQRSEFLTKRKSF